MLYIWVKSLGQPRHVVYMCTYLLADARHNESSKAADASVHNYKPQEQLHTE